MELQATHGNITDKDAYKKALYAREAEASTYVDNGITVPHARTACVTRPSLAALRLSTPVQYNADDDGKTDLLFAIAAPENGSLHIDMLARMMQMLMNDDFVESSAPPRRPLNFWTPSTRRRMPNLARGFATGDPRNGYRVLAVTACQRHCPHLHGRRGPDQDGGQAVCQWSRRTAPTEPECADPEEIAACDGIIIAADKNVETARFDGKPVIFARVDDGIHKPEELIKKLPTAKPHLPRRGRGQDPAGRGGATTATALPACTST